VDAKPYFASIPWKDVEEINAKLCQAGGYQVGRTSDGYEPTRKLWEEKSPQPLTFLQAADLCRQCHRLSPFLFLNGNTFASSARVALAPAMEKLGYEAQTVSRAALGHYIAGTIERPDFVAIVPFVLGE
jgi:hypothetical protein